MPAYQATDVQVNLWNTLETGDEMGARHLFNQHLPLINFERLHGVAAYKEVLYRRGIFATRCSRHPGATLDNQDRRELDAIMTDVEPLFTI